MSFMMTHPQFWFAVIVNMYCYDYISSLNFYSDIFHVAIRLLKNNVLIRALRSIKEKLIKNMNVKFVLIYKRYGTTHTNTNLLHLL